MIDRLTVYCPDVFRGLWEFHGRFIKGPWEVHGRMGGFCEAILGSSSRLREGALLPGHDSICIAMTKEERQCER